MHSAGMRRRRGAKQRRNGNIIEFINSILSLVKRFVFPGACVRESGLSRLILAFGHNLWNENNCTPAPRGQETEETKEKARDRRSGMAKVPRTTHRRLIFIRIFRFYVNADMPAARPDTARHTHMCMQTPSVTNKLVLDGNVYRAKSEHTHQMQ